MNERHYIVFDTECTGLKKRLKNLNQCASFASHSEVIQIGGLILDESKEIQKAFCLNCDCIAEKQDEGAQNVNGLDLNEIRKILSGKFLAEVLITNVPEFFGPNNVYVGYNTEYDISMCAASLIDFVEFKPKKLSVPAVPKTGSYYIDIMPYLAVNGFRKKLSAVSQQVLNDVQLIYDKIYDGSIPVYINDKSILQDLRQSHNALYDAVCTYKLWR